MTQGDLTEYPRLLHTVLDTTDVRALAEFYRELLGLAYRPGDEPPESGPDTADWLVLEDPEGRRVLAFQLVERLERTTWPSPDVPMQLHLDFTVSGRGVLETHRQRALGLGASLVVDRADDPDEPLYVFADPAGHPFCIFVRRPVPTDEAEQVVEAARARAAALAAGDAEALGRLLHEQFRWTAHTGATFDREEYVRRNTDGQVRWRSQDLREVSVVVDGATAVLRAEVVDVVLTEDGEPTTYEMPVTQVWVRSAGRWRCLAGHAGPRPARS